VFLGAGLAAFYVGPAVLELGLVQIYKFTTDVVDFHRHFVPVRMWVAHLFDYQWNYFGASVTNPNDQIPLHITLVHWIFLASAVALVAVRIALRKVDAATAGILAWLVITGCGLFIMSRVSVGIWELLPPFAYIQFPWRYFMVISIASGVLAALVVSAVPNRRVQAAMMIVSVAVQMHFYERRLRPDRLLPVTTMNIDELPWHDAPGDLSARFHEAAFDPAAVAELPDERIGRWTVLAGIGDIEANRAADEDLELQTRSAAAMTLRINTHAFPEWRVQVDRHDVPVHVTPQLGYMEVDVARGEHVVSARFGNTRVRTVSNVISVLSAVAIGALLVIAARARDQR
jgi:hypothetical protein